ncbi:MAG: sulfite exporter TauE/SafE family protein [Actinomycetota bacterium]
MPEQPLWKLAAIGLAAGIASGLFGVGGGILIVPMLVLACGFEQHRAHVTALATGIVLGTAAATTYAVDGSVDAGVAAALAIGSIAGVPLGARVMARMSAPVLTAAFGILLVVVAGLMAF